MAQAHYTKEQRDLALQINDVYQHLVCLVRAYSEHWAPDSSVMRSIDMCMHTWKVSGMNDHLWQVRAANDKGLIKPSNDY